MMMKEKGEVGLAEAIKALRRELQTAVEEGADESIRFLLGPIDLELQVETGRTGEGGAQIAFWLVSAGGKGSKSSKRTHTLRMTLSVAGDEEFLVGSSRERRPD
jgi:Trypsin-co-occurring domain 2